MRASEELTFAQTCEPQVEGESDRGTAGVVTEPLAAARGEQARAPRRVLFICHSFPPTGGAGSLRVLRFIRYLARTRWQPHVICARPLPEAVLDASLQRMVPADVPVDALSSFEPGRFSDSWDQPFQKVVRNLFRTFDFLLVPDEHVGFIRPALGRAASLLARSAFEAIVTTGPPFSTHLIGLGLSKRFGVPWIADFRDDWTGFNHTFRGGDMRRGQAYECRVEHDVLTRATRVLTINQSLGEALRGRCPGARVEVIPNGWDPADFPVPGPAQATAPPLVLTHAGTLYEQRSPAPLLEAIRRLSREQPLEGRLEARFYGRLTGPTPALVAADDLKGVVRFHGFVRHEESVRAMLDSHVLVLIIDQVEQADQISTGKVFEYLGARRPILALMPPMAPLADVLRSDWPGHMIVPGNDVEAIAAALRRLMEACPPSPVPSSAVAESYRADRHAVALSDLLDQAVVP